MRFAIALLCCATTLVAQDHMTGTFHGCPPEGKRKSSKGFYDATLNALKNRDVAPTSADDRALTDVIANHPSSVQAMGKKSRDQWTQPALDAVANWEATGTRVEGRLIAIRTQGPEACNCGSTNDVDFHLWIATQASKTAKPKHSMVIEISPRTASLQALHDQLVQLSKKGTRVRITGWMLWDEEHGSEVGKSRGTLWEIHPIHKIEINQNGNWQELQ